jgi:hypothetical protein
MNTPTKTQVKKLMAANNVPGELSGRGRNWEVELPNDEAHELWNATMGVSVGGYRSGCGTWVLRPGYVSKGDYNDPSSAWHY